MFNMADEDPTFVSLSPDDTVIYIKNMFVFVMDGSAHVRFLLSNDLVSQFAVHQRFQSDNSNGTGWLVGFEKKNFVMLWISFF